MEFALSEEQELLVDSVSKMLASACSVDELRSQASGEITFSDKINNEFIGMGLNGLLVPEDLGGSGLGILEASLISEQIGKFAAPAIWVGNSVMTPMCLSNGDNKELAEKWLPKIADGSSTSGIAINEFISKREDNGLSLDDGKISGISIFAIDAEKNPDIIITAVEDELYLIETANEKIEISNLPTIDTTRVMSEIVFHSCTAHKINGGKELIKKIIDSGRVVLSADLLGASQNMLDKAIEYSLERKQFNRIIGSFQAVKHMCAEMAADLEPCRSLVWYASYAQNDIPEESHLTACHAKAHLSEVAHDIARTATQVHGGMGFTDLLGLHYWFKRIGLTRQIFGGPEIVRKEAAVSQGFLNN